MKTFIGIRTEGGCRVIVDGAPLDPHFEIRYHSPDGFDWGEESIGAMQLAAALLAETLVNKQMVEAWYEEFMWAKLIPCKADRWEMTSDVIIDWMIAETKKLLADDQQQRKTHTIV